MARLHLRSEILSEGRSITPTSRQQRQSKEAVAKRFSVEKMFLEILQNWQENICASINKKVIYQQMFNNSQKYVYYLRHRFLNQK